MRLLAAAFVLLLISAVGCANLPAPGSAGDAGKAADQPRSGGLLNFAIPRDPFDHDVSYSGTGSPPAFAMAYESLLGFKSGPEVEYADLVLKPELAERWQASPDARTFTFTLRKGARFADLLPVNGRAITSTDVKFSYEYWSRTGEFKDKKLPPGQNAAMFEGLERVDAPEAGPSWSASKSPSCPS